MKYFRLSLVASVLTLILALSAFAGDMETGIASPSGNPTVAGDISRPRLSKDPMAEIALNLMQSMLALF